MVKAKTGTTQNGTARGYAAASDPDFALLQLQSELENDEGADRITSLRTIGKILMQKHRYDDAAAVFGSLLTLDPTSVQTQEALARCLERLGRWSEAVARYQLVLEADPQRADALVGMGLCLLRQDQLSPALTAFNRCLAVNAFHAGALLGKATCLRLTGDAAGAEAIYREAGRVLPEIEAALGEFIGGATEAPASETPALEAHATETHTIQARASTSEIADLENIIASAVAAEDYVTAAEHCRTLTERVPDYYEAWFNLGVFELQNAEIRNADFAPAVEAFRAAIRQRPLSVEPLEALARCYHLQGDWKATEASYLAALALAPDSPDLIWNLALLLEQRGDWAGAAHRYSHLVKVDQDRGETWFRLGLTRVHSGEHEGAVVAFRRALDLGAKTFESTFNLGLAYWKLDRSEPAVEHFRAALKIQPNFAPAQRGLAALALHEGDLSLARDLHRDLVERGDASPDILFNLAVFEHRANRLHSAIELYQQVLAFDPHPADAAAGLALAERTLAARRHT